MIQDLLKRGIRLRLAENGSITAHGRLTNHDRQLIEENRWRLVSEITNGFTLAGEIDRVVNGSIEDGSFSAWDRKYKIKWAQQFLDDARSENVEIEFLTAEFLRRVVDGGIQ